MKMMVKLVVLFATLVLLTGVAFADWENCYEVTCTNLDTDFKITHNVGLYLDPWGSQSGRFYGLCNAEGDMSLFFDSMSLQALAYSETNPYAYLKFHGDSFHVVNGIVYCYGDRWTIRGHKIDHEDCIWGDAR